MSIEHSLSNSNLCCEKHPLVLVVEAGDDTDNHELEREGDHADHSDGNEENKEHSFPLENFLFFFSEKSSKSNEHTK